MDESKLDLLRYQAFECFKYEKNFLRQLEDSKENSDLSINLISNATDNQLKCCIFILFFIFKKEIPVEKQLVSKFKSNAIEDFQNVLKQDPMQIFQSFSRNKYLSIVLGFRKVWPYLVHPILHKNG